MDRIKVNIISPKLTQKGRRTKILMIISFGLIFLVYPINLLIGDGPLFMSITILVFINMFFWLIYNNLIEKYIAIGHIIFDRDQVIIEEKSSRCNYKIAEITNFTILYQGYLHEPFLTIYRPYMRNATGYENVLSFQSQDRNLKFKFAIPNKTVGTFLNRQFDNYKKLGADIKIIRNEKFVEF